MKAVQVVAPGQAQFVETPSPTLIPGHAIVRPITLGLCGSDIWMWRHAPLHRYPFPVGTTGHEMVGIVEAMDGEHPAIREGDRALVIVPDHRAMAEKYLTPLSNLIPAPPNLATEHVVQGQQFGTVIYACKQLPNLIGKRVAVIGQGSAGMWFNFMCRRMGASRVIGIDLQRHRLAVSKNYGATDIIHNRDHDAVASAMELLNGQLPDIVIEAAGKAEATNLALRLAREEGFILGFGVPHQTEFLFDYESFFTKRLQFKAMVYAAREAGHTSTVAALAMIANGEIDVAPLITHRFPFERVFEAYELQGTRDEGNIKIIIDMPELT